MSDLISRQAAIDALEKSKEIYFDRQVIIGAMKGIVRSLPSAQPEEASMILCASKDGVRLWYQCSACGEPVNVDDNYCCNCGRRFING
jgi:hypothetical protein